MAIEGMQVEASILKKGLQPLAIDIELGDGIAVVV
jgi:hypothetical protein